MKKRELTVYLDPKYLKTMESPIFTQTTVYNGQYKNRIKAKLIIETPEPMDFIETHVATVVKTVLSKLREGGSLNYTAYSNWLNCWPGYLESDEACLKSLKAIESSLSDSKDSLDGN